MLEQAEEGLRCGGPHAWQRDRQDSPPGSLRHRFDDNVRVNRMEREARKEADADAGAFATSGGYSLPGLSVNVLAR